MSQPRRFTSEFKVAIARRILKGESVSALHRELRIARSVLYRWRDAYWKDPEGGLSRQPGRTPGVPAAGDRIGELERKIGQQALEIDFLARAFKRVKEDRRRNTGAGDPASTERSEK